MSLPNRVLYTGDCTYLFQDEIYNSAGGPYTAKVFHDHVDLLANCGVDTVLVNPNGQLAYYPSKTLPKFYDTFRSKGRESIRRHAIHCDGIPQERLEKHLDEQVRFLQNYLDLEQAGVDWVAEMAKACRRRKIAPWLSIRMNDVHGSPDPEGSYMNCDLYRNPEMRLRGSALKFSDGVTLGWQGLNYERREVRDHMMAIIREVVCNYDYEGLELDWLRNPFACNPIASQSAIDMMIEWTAEIRKLTQARAEQIGKPYPLGMRVPGHLEMVRSTGLDVAAIIQAKLIDFLSPSNFWQTSWDMPHDNLRDRFGDAVTIFGVVEDAPNWVFGRSPKYQRSGPRMLSASPELLRGNAAGKLALGAEGIETFNFFCTDAAVWQTSLEKEGVARYETLSELASLEKLRGKPKHYALSTSGRGTWYPPYELPEQLPAVLEPQSRRAFRLPMCAEPVDGGLELVVQLIVARKDIPLPTLGVSVNGEWPTFDSQETDRFIFPVGIFTHVLPEHVALNFRFPVKKIVNGWNEFVIYNNVGFYELITTGHRPTPEELMQNSVRIMSLEVGIKPSAEVM